MMLMSVQVSTNASAALGNARIAGNASYDPASAITVYYAQVRSCLIKALSVVFSQVWTGSIGS